MFYMTWRLFDFFFFKGHAGIRTDDKSWTIKRLFPGCGGDLEKKSRFVFDIESPFFSNDHISKRKIKNLTNKHPCMNTGCELREYSYDESFLWFHVFCLLFCLWVFVFDDTVILFASKKNISVSVCSSWYSWYRMDKTKKVSTKTHTLRSGRLCGSNASGLRHTMSGHLRTRVEWDVARHSRLGIRDIGRSCPVDSNLWTFVAGITCRIRIGTHGWRAMASRVKTKSIENLHLTAWFVQRLPPASVPREYAACAWRCRAPCARAARAPNATAPGAVSLPPRFSILFWNTHRFSGRKLSWNACLPSFRIV